jgi:2-polyprenyl-3-methyl-5-hydroxy-6-metoxy-1,4-benzoquinol methylase
MSALSPTLQALSEAIVAGNPVHAEFLAASFAGLSAEARQDLQEYVEYNTGRGRTIGYLAECYNTITNDTLNEQFFFMKHGRYRYSKYSEVADKVYLDPEYMNKYMYGLALTAFLWPNHAKMYDFFKQSFPRGKKGSYLEIGPGHGYYLRTAAELGDFDRLVGVDVSPTSVALTKDILEHSSLETAAEIDIIQSDFLAAKSDERDYSCIVTGEVLEHVEEPGLFLRKIAELSNKDTHIFVTTCVNAPSVDHIFLWRTTDAIEDLIRESGLEIVEPLHVPITGKTLEQCRKDALPISVAYVLRKA